MIDDATKLSTIEYFLIPGDVAAPDVSDLHARARAGKVFDYLVGGVDLDRDVQVQFHDIAAGKYTVCVERKLDRDHPLPLVCKPLEVRADAQVVELPIRTSTPVAQREYDVRRFRYKRTFAARGHIQQGLEMHGHLHRVIALALAAAPVVAHADDGQADDWRFKSTSRSDAVRVQANTLYPTTLAEVRLSYQHIDDGGSLSALTGLVQVPMPYILIPGVRASNWFSLVELELPVATLKIPMASRVTGLSDMSLLDAAITHWDRWAAGFGVGLLIPSATEDLLGTGSLAVGPVAGLSGSFGSERQLIAGVALQSLTTVAGAEDRPDLNVLLVRPTLTYILPHATYVALESRMVSDWERRGHTTVPLTGRFGVAANDNVVVVLQPTWVARGDGQDDLTITVIASYVDW